MSHAIDLEGYRIFAQHVPSIIELACDADDRSRQEIGFLFVDELETLYDLAGMK